MKKSYLVVLVLCAVVMSACKSQFAIIPKAVNTVNAVSLSELNLERKDYKILKNVTAEASVVFHSKGSGAYSIKEQNGEFELNYKRDKFGNWILDSFKGIARYGFLSNDYGHIASVNDMSTEMIARNVAIYRLINACKVAGGDGLIEPIVSMSIGEGGRNEVVFKVSATAKVIKIDTDK